MRAFPDRRTEDTRLDELHRARAEAERSIDRWRAVERQVRAITGAMVADEVLTQLRLAVLPALADVVLVDCLAGQTLERVRVDVADPLVEDEVRVLARSAPPPVAQHPIALALETGRSELVDDFAESRLLLRRIGARTALVVPLAARGRTLGVITLIYIGVRRHGREELEMAESLAQAAATALDNARLFASVQARVRERDQHLATVAHDLKNPLLAARMEAERLLRDPVAIPEAAARISRQTRAMSQMVVELLELGSYDDGRAHLTTEAIDPAALIDEALDTFAPIAGAEGVTLKVRLQPEPLPRVCCDRARIWQVLSNLLANAIRHGQGGRVVMSARVVAAPIAQAGEVQFSVEDAGRGMSEQTLAQLFEPGHSSPGSSGLGLAICRRIVEAHGGWIWAESVPGQGAAFHFTLPTEPID